MDNIPQIITQFLSAIIVILGGSAGVWFGTEAIKRVKAIPINEGQKTKLRATAAVFSAVVAVLSGLAGDNTLTPDSITELITQVATFGLVWLGSHSMHKDVSVIKQ